MGRNVTAGKDRRIRVWLALAAMLAQLFFSTAHLTAMAATISGPVSLAGTPAGALGLLEICTANGLLRVSPDSSLPQPSDSADQCPVCASAAMTAFTDAAVKAEPIALAAETVIPAARPDTLWQDTIILAGAIRAPPAS